MYKKGVLNPMQVYMKMKMAKTYQQRQCNWATNCVKKLCLKFISVAELAAIDARWNDRNADGPSFPNITNFFSCDRTNHLTYALQILRIWGGNKYYMIGKLLSTDPAHFGNSGSAINKNVVGKFF